MVATWLVRVLTHLNPQRWCPPTISLRLFRWSFEANNAMTTVDLRRQLPAAGWTTRADLSYAQRSDCRFDLVLPDGPGPHPWLLWVHGGGWHFGDKSDVLPYVELLGTRGFAGAVVNYPLAPHAKYPAAPRAVNEALAHLIKHAEEYRLDRSRVVLAGDSAGAQIASELAALVTNRQQAAASTITPALTAAQLRGAMLFCGIFDPTGLDDSNRMFEAVLESAMWSVTRSRTWKDSPACRAMTVVDHVTADFPPTFLAAGNQDPLTRRQAPAMAARLRQLGVPLEEYYPGDEAEPSYHEFQLRLGTPAAAEALERAVSFLERVTSISH